MDHSKNPLPIPVASDGADSPQAAEASLPEATFDLPQDLQLAVYGAQEKKAEDFRLLDLRGVTSLTEFFVVCAGSNQRQNQAISDEVFRLLKEKRSRLPLGVEGYEKADWILMDYGDFIVHILSGQARKFYDLERLWRQAKEIAVPDDLADRLAGILKSDPDNKSANGTAQDA